jgi:hypothetical protein
MLISSSLWLSLSSHVHARELEACSTVGALPEFDCPVVGGGDVRNDGETEAGPGPDFEYPSSNTRLVSSSTMPGPSSST